MKKIMVIVSILSFGNFVYALPKIRPVISEGTILGQQLIKELNENVKAANEMHKSATNSMEKEEAARAAREAAQNLIDALNDIKTFGNDIVKGYNSKQIQIAAITLAELLTRLHTLKIEIKSKRMEIADMTNVGVFVDSAVAGKEEQRSKAIKELQYFHKTKKDIKKAIEDQKVILGTTWSSIITAATYNLLIGNSRGICYEIDWSFGAHNPKILEDNQPSIKKITRTQKKLTKTQHAAIKSWHRLSKSELLSKEITSTRQLDEAKSLVEQLNNIKEDLKNVPVKYKDILYRVTTAINSLEDKMATAKKNWLKIV